MDSYDADKPLLPFDSPPSDVPAKVDVAPYGVADLSKGTDSDPPPAPVVFEDDLPDPDVARLTDPCESVRRYVPPLDLLLVT